MHLTIAPPTTVGGLIPVSLPRATAVVDKRVVVDGLAVLKHDGRMVDFGAGIGVKSVLMP